MPSLLDRDPFESYLRAVEAKLPSLEQSLRALRDRDADELYASAVAGTILEPVIDRGLEERWGLKLVEERVWDAVAEMYREIRECAPSSYAPVLEAFEALIDLENLGRIFSGVEIPEKLVPLGPLRSCLARESASVERCLSESSLARYVETDQLARALSSLDDLLYVYVYARLSIYRDLLSYFESVGADLPVIESVRNMLVAEVAHINSFCSLSQCPESIHRGVRDALGIDASRASDLARSRAGEELVEAIERGREARDSVEELEAINESAISPLLSVGEGPELLLAVLRLLYIGSKLSLAAYALKEGMLSV